MTVHHAKSVVVRGGMRVVAVLAMLVLIPVAVPAPAYAYADWSGSFVGAAADSPVVTPGATAVRFTVSQKLQVPGTVGAYVVVRNAAGVEVGFCTSGAQCVVYSNPDAGTSQSFTAQLRTQRNGQTVTLETAGPVTVTDPGWQGSFSYAYADNPTPALSVSTAVRFGFTQALSGASVTVTDDAGRFVRTCSSGTECLVAANPAAGMTTSYTARLYVQLAGSMVEREAHTVSVTDPGWQGTIMPAATNDMFVEAGKSTTVSFDLSTPLEAASVEILVDGTYQRTCGPNSSPSVCGVNASFSAAPIHTVKAVLTAQRAGGWQEIGSVMTYVTTLTEEQFAQWLLDPATDLSVLENPALVSALLAIQAQPLTLAYCVAVGEKIPTHSAEGTPTDTTLGCTGGALTMRQMLASAIATLGLVAGVYVLSEATAATEAPTATPFPISPPLPPVPGQDTTGGGGGGSTTDPSDTGGGGTADNSPDGETAWALGSKSAGAVWYAPEAPEYWRDPTLCRVTFVDPVTGEEREVRLTAGALRHSLEGHGLAGDNEVGRWNGEKFYPGVTVTVPKDFEDKTEPADYERLIEYICSALVEGTFVDGGLSLINRNNLVYNFTMEDFMGTERATGFDTKDLSVIVAPDGSISSSYPGRTEFEEIPAPIEGV